MGQTDATQHKPEEDENRLVDDVHGIGTGRHGFGQRALLIESLAEPDQQTDHHPHAKESLPEGSDKSLPLNTSFEQIDLPLHHSPGHEYDGQQHDADNSDPYW